MLCNDAKTMLRLAVNSGIDEEIVMSFYNRLVKPTGKQAVDITTAITAASDEKWAQWATQIGVFYAE